jgi:hypothetical protein
LIQVKDRSLGCNKTRTKVFSRDEIGILKSGLFRFGRGDIKMTGVLRAIERWASANDDRMRLAIVLVWASFGMFVLITTLIAARIMLPPEYHLF